LFSIPPVARNELTRMLRLPAVYPFQRA